MDFVEPGVECLRRVETAHDGVLVAREPPLFVLSDLLVRPAHERMFAYGGDLQAIAALRRLRFTGPDIAEILNRPVSTVWDLTRIGLGKLGRLGM